MRETRTKPGLRFQWCWLLMACALSLLACAPARADDSEELTATKLEYQVKAGFLFNFAKFVAWPTNAPGGPDKLLIGILDDGNVYPILAGELTGKRVGNRAVETKRCKRGDDLKQFEMIFITRAKEARLADVRVAVAGAPVLTVGESDRFAERGGCINFVRKGENIRFEVNLAAAERAGLKVSSKIAAMAIIVRSEEVKK